MVVKFAMRERDPRVVIRQGEAPLVDFREVEKNANPRQPVCSWERFVKITEAADRVTWKAWWTSKPQHVRAPVKELIELSYYLGKDRPAGAAQAQ